MKGRPKPSSIIRYVMKKTEELASSPPTVLVGVRVRVRVGVRVRVS